jgi:hypothetical protein
MRQASRGSSSRWEILKRLRVVDPGGRRLRRRLRRGSGMARAQAPWRVDEFDANGDDTEGFPFGWIDLADDGQLFFAGGERV